MVQSVARGPLEPKILVRVQVPEPLSVLPRVQKKPASPSRHASGRSTNKDGAPLLPDSSGEASPRTRPPIYPLSTIAFLSKFSAIVSGNPPLLVKQHAPPSGPLILESRA